MDRSIPHSFKRADLVQETFREQIVARYGIPSVLITDNGGEFTSKNFEAWLASQGIDHRVTSPYNPQCNGKIERFNGTLQKLLMKLTSVSPENGPHAYQMPYMHTESQRVQQISLPMKVSMGNVPGFLGHMKERLREVHLSTELLSF